MKGMYIIVKGFLWRKKEQWSCRKDFPGLLEQYSKIAVEDFNCF